MMNEDFSCIKEVTKIVNLTLPSMYNTNEISGICDTLESWKRQYVKQLQGIVVGYKNVSLTSKRGYLKLESPAIYCNVKATFELFYPTIGCIIKGKINRISQDYIGCLVHDTINVTVRQTDDLSSDISKFIVLDHFILFQITGINLKPKFIHVKGKITEECVTLMKESGLLSEDIDVCDNNSLACPSPDLFSNVGNSDPITSNSNTQNAGELDMSTDNSSQASSHKKKKKHKKSKENFLMSPSLISGTLENNIDQVELTQSSAITKKRKRKKSDVNLSSPSNAEDKTEPVHPKKKIKTEGLIFNDINQGELFQSPDKTRKRKRKKSDGTLSSPSNSLENETEPIHRKKKMKTAEQISWMNDTKELLEKDSSLMSSDISNSENANSIEAATFTISSSNIAAEIGNSAVKLELPSPVKKKKHKKSKNNLEVSSSSDHTLTEINESAQSSFLLTGPQKTTPSSHIKSEEDFLTSPDLLGKSLSELKSETEPVKPKKKKETVSEKSKSHKKKKDKLKKGSKKDKKKKPKVISTKKKLHGPSSKLKKKKNKDKKSKEGKKNKDKKSKGGKKNKSKSDKTMCA